MIEDCLSWIARLHNHSDLANISWLNVCFLMPSPYEQGLHAIACARTFSALITLMWLGLTTRSQNSPQQGNHKVQEKCRSYLARISLWHASPAHRWSACFPSRGRADPKTAVLTLVPRGASVQTQVSWAQTIAFEVTAQLVEGVMTICCEKW